MKYDKRVEEKLDQIRNLDEIFPYLILFLESELDLVQGDQIKEIKLAKDILDKTSLGKDHFKKWYLKGLHEKDIERITEKYVKIQLSMISVEAVTFLYKILTELVVSINNNKDKFEYLDTSFIDLDERSSSWNEITDDGWSIQYPDYCLILYYFMNYMEDKGYEPTFNVNPDKSISIHCILVE